jgi:hypothetical protein
MIHSMALLRVQSSGAVVTRQMAMKALIMRLSHITGPAQARIARHS